MPALALPAFWGAITAGAAGTAGIVGAKISSNAGKEAAATQSDAGVKAAQIQADSANKQAELQASSAKQALDYSRSQSQLSLDQYNQQQTRLQPYRNLGAFALGQPMSDAPAALTLPNLPGTQTTPSSSALPSGSQSSASGGDPAAYTLSLIQGGMSAQQAAQQTNAKFNLQTGSQAVYYPENNTIGLPGAYLAGPTNKPDSPKEWGIVPRSGGGGSAPAAATAGPVKLNFTPSRIGASGANMMPVTGTLQAPQTISPYRTLSQIAGV